MSGTRKTLGLTIGTMLVCLFAFLALQAGTPEANASESIPTTLGWLGGCYPPVLGVGRYFPGDAPCRPSRLISLSEIEFGLKMHGVMRLQEHLEYAPNLRARALTCWGVIKDHGQAAGWLCADEEGLYRVDMAGRMVSGRWQILADDTWQPAE